MVIGSWGFSRDSEGFEKENSPLGAWSPHAIQGDDGAITHGAWTLSVALIEETSKAYLISPQHMRAIRTHTLSGKERNQPHVNCSPNLMEFSTAKLFHFVGPVALGLPPTPNPKFTVCGEARHVYACEPAMAAYSALSSTLDISCPVNIAWYSRLDSTQVSAAFHSYSCASLPSTSL